MRFVVIYRLYDPKHLIGNGSVYDACEGSCTSGDVAVGDRFSPQCKLLPQKGTVTLAIKGYRHYAVGQRE